MTVVPRCVEKRQEVGMAGKGTGDDTIENTGLKITIVIPGVEFHRLPVGERDVV